MIRRRHLYLLPPTVVFHVNVRMKWLETSVKELMNCRDTTGSVLIDELVSAVDLAQGSEVATAI